ncbi:MAG: phosphate ABC transporter permease PstA [Candidatus Thermoplasmatota archaeon]
MTGVATILGDARLASRRRTETAWRFILLGTALFVVGILLFLLYRLLADGVPHLSRSFFFEDYKPSALTRSGAARGVVAGIKDSIIASLYMLGMTMLAAIPVGTAAGIYLHEYAPANRFTNLLRTTISNLAGVPSVVYGLLGLAVFVRLLDMGVNLMAAALTLAVLIVPILIVATEEALKTVPASVREASLALGATKWQTIRKHVLPYALPGILTGNILAMSRAAGETAPLLVIGVPAYVTITATSPLDAGTPLQVRSYFLASDARIPAIEMAAASVVVLLVATLLLNLVAIVLRQVLSKRIKW